MEALALDRGGNLMATKCKSNHTIEAQVELTHISGNIEDVVISGIPCVWDWDTNTREAAELWAIVDYVADNFIFSRFYIVCYHSSPAVEINT